MNCTSPSNVGEKCPFSIEEAYAVVEGVLVRTRIQPIKWTPIDTVLLQSDTQCEAYGDLWIYRTDMNFAFVDGETSIGSRYGANGYTSFGLVDHEKIKAAIRSATERAITDYLKANFDLGEDE